ncbi:hypothetical protein O0L34_g18410 [Tuta absoluta]|nr:hypothetical protein O0L34_g18410 [Tuta absoluta]
MKTIIVLVVVSIVAGSALARAFEDQEVGFIDLLKQEWSKVFPSHWKETTVKPNSFTKIGPTEDEDYAQYCDTTAEYEDDDHMTTAEDEHEAHVTIAEHEGDAAINTAEEEDDANITTTEYEDDDHITTAEDEHEAHVTIAEHEGDAAINTAEEEDDANITTTENEDDDHITTAEDEHEAHVTTAEVKDDSDITTDEDDRDAAINTAKDEDDANITTAENENDVDITTADGKDETADTSTTKHASEPATPPTNQPNQQPPSSTTSTTMTSVTEQTPPSSQPTDQPPSTTTFTTIAPLTTPTPPSCSGSIFSANDLKDLILHATNESHTLESIKKSYYEDAVNMRDTHVKALTMFSVWFIDQPNHLKQIVEDLSQNHKKIEQNLTKIAKHLKIAVTLAEYETLKTTIAEQEAQTNRVKALCDLSCPPHSLSSRHPLFITDVATAVPDQDHYCGKIADVYSKIKARLMTFTKNEQESFMTRIKQDNGVLIKKLEVMRNYLKDFALKQFGHTMYDVLNLIDDYRNLQEKFNVDQVHDRVIRNKENIASIDLHLLKLRDHSKRVMEKCKKCNIDYALGSYSLPNQNEDKDLLEKIIEENEKEIMNTINEEYNKIFEGLNDDLVVDKPDNVNKYLQNLNKIHGEVTALAENERKTFTKIFESFPIQKLKAQELIADGAEELSKTLEAIEDKLKKIEESVH